MQDHRGGCNAQRMGCASRALTWRRKRLSAPTNSAGVIVTVLFTADQRAVEAAAGLILQPGISSKSSVTLAIRRAGHAAIDTWERGQCSSC